MADAGPLATSLVVGVGNTALDALDERVSLVVVVGQVRHGESGGVSGERWGCGWGEEQEEKRRRERG